MKGLRYHLRRFGWSQLILAAVLAAAFSSVRRASAHAFVVKTEPADSAVLDQAPAQARLWFSEGIILDATKISLIDSQGTAFPLKVAGLEKDPTADEPLIVVIDLPALPSGIYNLAWQTVSSDDLHTTADSIVFGVHQTPPVHAAANLTTAAPGTDEVVLHWLFLAGLAGLAGALAFSLFLRGAGKEATVPLLIPARRRLLHLALLAGLISFLAGIGLLLVQQAFVPGTAGQSSPYVLILQSHYGRYWLASQGLLTGLIFILSLMLSLAGRPALISRLMTLAVVLVVALHGIASLSSHPVTVLGFTLPHLLINTIHLVAASLWAGGLLVLAVIVAPWLRGAPPERALGLVLMRRFGGLAAACVAALAITGLYLSGQLVATPDALVESRYGWTLILKLMLVLGVGLFGLLNSASLHPQVAEPTRRLLRRQPGWKPFQLSGLGRTVMIEASLIGLVLILAAALGSTQPARGPQFDPPPAAASVTTETSARVNDLVVSLSVKPDRPGENFVSLNVFNTRRPAPAPFSQVLVRFSPPDGAAKGLNVVADAVGAGLYQVSGAAFDAPGVWKISVQVQRPGLPDAALEIPWSVLPALPPASERPVLISNRPLAPVASSLAVGLVLVLFLAILVRQIIGRSRRLAASVAQAPSSD